MQHVGIYDEATLTSDAGQSDTHSLSVLDWAHNRDLLLMLTLDENSRLKAALIEANNRIKELEEENQKLFELSNLGTDTSGIPSGKDWKKNGVARELEETTDSNACQGEIEKETPISVTDYLKGGREKKLPGGQKNHPPASMRVSGAREGVPIRHYPDKCNACPLFGQCLETGRFRRYHTNHEYDVEVNLVHTEHQLFETADCLRDGSQIRADIPEGIIGTRFYGMNVQLNVLTWHHLFHGSYERVAQAAKELFGLSLSAGTANAIIKRASAKILGSGFMDAVRYFILLFEAVLGVDETSARTGGRNAWVHTAVTNNVTLLSAHWRRGYEGTIYSGVVQFFTHTLLSDCWASYFNENLLCKNAICDAHILRELVAAAYFRGQSWAIKMFDLLLEAFEAKRDAIEREESCLPQAYIDDVRARYRHIVASGYNEIGDVTKGKTFSLLERLKKLEDAALAFAVDFNVDFTNNVSEISIRDIKVVLRVIGQFKTMPGLVDYCIIQSFMDTCRKQGHNPFDMMRLLLSGGDIIEAVFGSEKAMPIKQLISLTKALENGDANHINAIKADMGAILTDQLIAAASHGRFKAFNDAPPVQKNSPTVPKDKMKAAREKDKLKTPSQNVANNSEARIRAGPLSD